MSTEPSPSVGMAPAIWIQLARAVLLGGVEAKGQAELIRFRKAARHLLSIQETAMEDLAQKALSVIQAAEAEQMAESEGDIHQVLGAALTLSVAIDDYKEALIRGKDR